MNIRGSVVIRKKIIEIIRQYSLDYYDISKYLCIPYPPFMMWINADDGGHDGKNVPEHKIRELCRLLGIEIIEKDKKIQMIIHPFPKESVPKTTNPLYRKFREEQKQRRKNKNDKFFED